MSEHGHSHEHQAPKKPKTESYLPIKKDTPVPRKKLGDKLRNFFSFHKSENPQLEEINFFKHELLDNKDALLSEINNTIHNEASAVANDIKNQIKIVHKMLENGMINGKQAQELSEALTVKLQEAKEAEQAVISELTRIDPDFNSHTAPQVKEKKSAEKRYKRASEIFAAIQKGEIMTADILTKEEKQLMINTLTEKYKDFSNSFRPQGQQPYDADKSYNNIKDDSEHEYEFYLDLANRIGFDGRLDISKKEKPATYTMIITGQKRKKVPSENQSAPAKHDSDSQPHGHAKAAEAHTTHPAPVHDKHSAPAIVTGPHESHSGGGVAHDKPDHPAKEEKPEHAPAPAEKTPDHTHTEPPKHGHGHETEPSKPKTDHHAEKVDHKPETKKSEQLLAEKLRTGDHFVILRIVNAISNKEINKENVNFVLNELVFKDKVFPQPDKIVRYLVYKSLKLKDFELAKQIAELGDDEAQKEMNRSLVKTTELIKTGQLNTPEQIRQNIDAIADDKLRDDIIIIALDSIAKVNTDLAKEYFGKISSESAKNEALLTLSAENSDLAKELRANN